MSSLTRPTIVPSGSTYYGSGAASGDAYGSGERARFIPAIYSKKVLRNFYASTVFADICNTDYEGEIKNQGDTVFIRKTPDITIGDYTVGATLTYQVPKKDATKLTIDIGKYSAFKVDDVDKAQSDLQLVSMFAEDVGMNMNITVDTEVLAYLYTKSATGNYGASAGAISGNINLGAANAPVVTTTVNAIDNIVNANQVLDEQNTPSEGRYIVMPAWNCALLKLGDLRRADVTGDSTGVIRNGMIGQVDRTTIYMNNNLNSATDATTGNLCHYVIFGTKEASTFAAQITKTDTLKIQDSFGEYWRTLFVYGREVVQPTAIGYLYTERG